MVITTTVDSGTPTTITLNFAYDASGTPMSVSRNGTTYYYATNLQGDITAILNSAGTALVQYTYDAWGNIHTTATNEALAEANPLRYRGYVYDTETEYYYVSTRYYHPDTNRFLNSDILISTGQGILGNNMFAYCRNNPVCRIDVSGMQSVDCFDEDGIPLSNNELTDNGGGGAVTSNGNTGAQAYQVNPSNPLGKISYTPKVIEQMQKGVGEYHSYPAVVDNYGGYGEQSIIVGNDGRVYFTLRIDGYYNGNHGQFCYIWDEFNVCNHRFFEVYY